VLCVTVRFERLSRLENLYMRTLTVLILLLPIVLSAQKNYPVLLDRYMHAQVNVNEFTGTVLVARKGKVIYEKAFGLADREWNIPNTIDTKFEIGSITKQFTAACVLQLAEEGKISLDDKLSRYFPDFPKADSVTIHMLLTHTSGIKDFTGLPEFGNMSKLPVEKDTMVALIKKQPFDFSPGTKWHYSSSGYYLLGYIIEKVTGKSYSDYVFEHVIQIAGLKNTCVNRWDTILLYRAKGYEKTPNEGWKNAYYISMEGPFSAGAIISTIEDLYQWNKALFSNQIISSAMLAKMTTPYMEHYGYGLLIDSFQQHLRIRHGGRINGFTSLLGYFPSDDVVVAGLSNNGNAFTGSFINALAAIVFDIPVADAYKRKAVTINSTILDRYAGKYQQQGASGLDTMIAKDGKLYFHTYWGGAFHVIPESATKFFLEELPDFQFEFELDNKGRITKAYTINAGVKDVMKKM
jgi:CubicO group peptidase (beta-lactamase class C family)